MIQKRGLKCKYKTLKIHKKFIMRHLTIFSITDWPAAFMDRLNRSKSMQEN
jgi:hypothetical protein